MEDIDFNKLFADMAEENLLEELRKFIGENPKSAVMFMIGRMIGKFEVLRQIGVISEAARDEVKELIEVLESKDDEDEA